MVALFFARFLFFSPLFSFFFLFFFFFFLLSPRAHSNSNCLPCSLFLFKCRCNISPPSHAIDTIKGQLLTMNREMKCQPERERERETKERARDDERVRKKKNKCQREEREKKYKWAAQGVSSVDRCMYGLIDPFLCTWRLSLFLSALSFICHWTELPWQRHKASHVKEMHFDRFFGLLSRRFLCAVHLCLHKWRTQAVGAKWRGRTGRGKRKEKRREEERRREERQIPRSRPCLFSP